MDSESLQGASCDASSAKPRVGFFRKLMTKHLVFKFFILCCGAGIVLIVVPTFERLERVQVALETKVSTLEAENHDLKLAFNDLKKKFSNGAAEEVDALKARLQALEESPKPSAVASSDERLQLLEILFICHELERRLEKNQAYQDLLDLLEPLVKTEREQTLLQNLKQGPLPKTETTLPRWLQPIRHLFSLTPLHEDESQEACVSKIKEATMRGLK